MERNERAESHRVVIVKLELKVAIKKEKKEILEKKRLKMQDVMELKIEGLGMSMSFQGAEGRKRP